MNYYYLIAKKGTQVESFVIFGGLTEAIRRGESNEFKGWKVTIIAGGTSYKKVWGNTPEYDRNNDPF